MAVVATAEVQILADTSRFGPDLRRKLQQAFQRIGLDTDDILGGTNPTDIGEDLGDGIREGLARTRNVTVAEGRKIGRGLADNLNRSIKRNVDIAVFRTLEEEATRSGGRAGRDFAAEFERNVGGAMIEQIRWRLGELSPDLNLEDFQARSKIIIDNAVRQQREIYRRVTRDISRRGAVAVEIDADMSPLERAIRRSLASTIPRQGRISGAQFAGAFASGFIRAFTGLTRSMLAAMSGLVRGIFTQDFEFDRIFAGVRRGFNTFREGVSQVTGSFRALISQIRESRREADRLKQSLNDASSGGPKVGFLVRLTANTKQLIDSIRKSVSSNRFVVSLVAGTKSLASSIRNAIQSAIPSGGSSGKSFASSFVSSFVSRARSVLTGAAKAISSVVSKIFSGIKGIDFNSIFSGFTKGVGALQSGIKKATSLVKGLFDGSQMMEGSLKGLADSGKTAGKSMQEMGKQGGKAGGAFGILAQIVQTLIQFMFTVGSLATTIYVVQAAIGAIIYAVQVLGGTLLIVGSILQQVIVGGLLLLPGIIVAVTGSMALLSRAFENFGSAAGAVDRLKTGFDNLLDSAASRVWSGLSDNIDNLSSKILPSLEKGFNAAADGMNSFFEDIIDSLAGDDVQKAITDIGNSVSTIFTGLGPAVGQVITAIAGLASAAAPVLERIGEATGAILTNFSGWIDSAIESGTIQEIFDNMFITLSSIGEIVGNLVEGFYNLFGYAVEGSQTFLDNIAAATENFAAWTESEEAKEFVEFLVDRASAFFAYIYNMIVEFKEWASSPEGRRLMETLVNQASNFFGFLKDTFVEFVEWAQSEEGIRMMEKIERAAQSFLGFIKDVAPAFTAVISGAIDLYNWLVGINDEFLEFIGLASGPRGRGGPEQVRRRDRAIPNAYGSIVHRPTLIKAGERYLPEVIMPLTNEDRVVQLARMSGVDKILERNGALGSSGPSVTVNVASNSVSPTAVAYKAVDMITRAWSGR